MLKGEPKTLSEAWGVTSKAIRRAGAVDVTLNCDTRLFVDPLLLASSKNLTFRKCAADTYRRRFTTVIKLLRPATGVDHAGWKAAEKQLSFPEMRLTHLGYSSGKTGSGFGEFLTASLMTAAKEVIEIGVDDPDLFMALALFEKDVGADRISDMTCTVILPCLVAFTQDVAKKLRIPLKKFSLKEIGDKPTLLPANPINKKEPIVLVPHDIVRDLPVASDWDSVSSAAQENQDLRDAVNKQIGDIWAAKTKRDRVKYRPALLASKKGFESFLDLVRTAADEPYDVDADHNGELYPSDVKPLLETQFPLELKGYARGKLKAKDVDDIVVSLIKQFKALIEDNGMWSLLWNEKTGKSKRKAKREQASQLLFFAACKKYCDDNDLDISPEADAGRGPVDFKLSYGSRAKVLVEVKKSTNTKLPDGYTEQLEAYKKAEKVKHAHYVVIDVHGLKTAKKEQLKKLQAAAKKQGCASTLWFIDAMPKASASKLKRAAPASDDE
jgi:hypothetical protein